MDTLDAPQLCCAQTSLTVLTALAVRGPIKNTNPRSSSVRTGRKPSPGKPQVNASPRIFSPKTACPRCWLNLTLSWKVTVVSPILCAMTGQVIPSSQWNGTTLSSVSVRCCAGLSLTRSNFIPPAEPRTKQRICSSCSPASTVPITSRLLEYVP